MKTYIIQKTKAQNVSMHSEVWKTVTPLQINHFAWDETGFRPETTAQMVYNEAGITVRFHSNETGVLARFTGVNEPVCRDSCVELFLNPCPLESADYLNIEVSAAGGILIGKGPDRASRKNLDGIQPEQFQIEKEVKEDGWTLKLFVPFQFLKRQCGSIQTNMRGNLQKCGDDTPKPHFASWNPIVAPQPDFHRPECFGEIRLG